MSFWNMFGLACLFDAIFGKRNRNTGYYRSQIYDPLREAELDERYNRLSERIDDLECRLDDIDPDSELYDDLYDDVEFLRDELDDLYEERDYYDDY